LSNPISNEFDTLRPTLLPDMLANVARNLARGTADLGLFELGRVFTRAPERPEEHQELCIALTGRRHPERFSQEGEAACDYYDLRGILDGLLEARRLVGCRFSRATHPALRPEASAALHLGDVLLGHLGEVHPEWVADMRIKHPLFVAIIDVTALLGLASKPSRFDVLPQFPATARDIAFVAAESLQHQEVLDAIAQLKLQHLEQVALFDIYRDEQALGPGRKSMAYSFTFRHPERTLNDKEVNAAYDQLRARLPELLPIEVR